jgi:hypothetical protein
MNPLQSALKKLLGAPTKPGVIAPVGQPALTTGSSNTSIGQAAMASPKLSPSQIKKLMDLQKEPRDDNPPFECAICHKPIPNRNDVVCSRVKDGKYSTLAFGVPANDWDGLVCSSKCAHAMLDQHIVTWRLRGLFNVPEEPDEY